MSRGSDEAHDGWDMAQDRRGVPLFSALPSGEEEGSAGLQGAVVLERLVVGVLAPIAAVAQLEVAVGVEGWPLAPGQRALAADPVHHRQPDAIRRQEATQGLGLVLVHPCLEAHEVVRQRQRLERTEEKAGNQVARQQAEYDTAAAQQRRRVVEIGEGDRVGRQTQQAQGHAEQQDQGETVLVTGQETALQERVEFVGEWLEEKESDDTGKHDVDEHATRGQQPLAPVGVANAEHDQDGQEGEHGLDDPLSPLSLLGRGATKRGAMTSPLTPNPSPRWGEGGRHTTITPPPRGGTLPSW